MVDTQRTYAELVALFPDNMTGEISPQDIRDLLLSLRAPIGQFNISTPSPQVIGSAGVFQKMTGTTVLSGLEYLFVDDGVNNRLRYIGTVPLHCLIIGEASFTSVSNNQIVDFTTAKNDIAGAANARVKIGTGTDLVQVTGHRITTLATDDYVEVYLANETSTARLDVQTLQYSVHGIFK